jgi:hypothetical protein
MAAPTATWAPPAAATTHNQQGAMEQASARAAAQGQAAAARWRQVCHPRHSLRQQQHQVAQQVTEQQVQPMAEQLVEQQQLQQQVLPVQHLVEQQHKQVGQQQAAQGHQVWRRPLGGGGCRVARVWWWPVGRTPTPCWSATGCMTPPARGRCVGCVGMGCPVATVAGRGRGEGHVDEVRQAGWSWTQGWGGEEGGGGGGVGRFN